MKTMTLQKPASSVKDLPEEWREAAHAFQPAVRALMKGRDVLEGMEILMTVVQEQISARKRPGDGMAAALARGMVIKEKLKQAEGGSLSAEETSKLLGISKEAVLKRYRRGQLLGWREAKQNAVRFPVWQFQDGQPLPGFDEVMAVLNRSELMDDWGRILFFMNHRDSLGGQRTLDLLRQGETGRVLRTALAYTAE